MKWWMKQFAVALVVAGLMTGCGGAPTASKDAETLKVGATPVPHAEVLKAAKPLLAEQGINLEIVEFTDYVRPNIALADGDLDANYFQHVPYLESFSADRGLDLANAGPVHLEPLGLYSITIGDLKEIGDGSLITIPDDPSNTGRALNLLAQNGLITLKDGAGIKATTKDIAGNPKNLKIELLNAEQLPRTLQDAAASVINTNYYLEAQKNLKLDAKVLARESAENNPYANIVAVRKGEESSPAIRKLMAVLQSPEIKQFIEETYGGAVAPAFE